MKSIKLFLLALLTIGSIGQAFAACDNPWDTASDGSRCGGRSSSSKPGGK